MAVWDLNQRCAPNATLLLAKAVLRNGSHFSRYAFRRAWLEPPRPLRACAPNAALLLAKTVLRNGSRSLRGLKAHAEPPGVDRLTLQSLQCKQ